MNEINSNQTPRFEQFPQRPTRRSAGTRTRLVLATAAVVGLTGGVGAAVAAHATGEAPAAQSPAAQSPATQGPAAAGAAPRSTDAGRPGEATDVMAPRSTAGSTASTSTGSTSTSTASTGSTQAVRSATPLLWASDTAIHDGSRVVRLQGVTEVAAVHRAGSGWVVEDVPADGPYVRLLKVTAAGRTTRAALGTPGGAFDASGSRYVSRARDDAHYEVVDLATGHERLVPAPAGDPAAEGTAVFAGSRGTELITAWLPLPSTRPADTVYYRSNLDGSHAAPLARGVAGARFSGGRSFFVGSTSTEGGIAGGRTSTDGTAPSPGWTAPGSLAASAPYSPDGTRVVAFADAGGSEQPSSTEQRTAVVRASATGRVIARVALPRRARDLTLADDGHVVVLRHTGSAAEPRVSVESCTLTGACHAVGSGRGIGVLGGPR